MPSARLLDIVVLAVLLVIAVRVVPAAWNVLRSYRGIRDRRLEDATALAPRPSDAVATTAQRLAAVGFRPMGVRSTVLPDGQRRFEWNMVDEPTTTFVSLVPAAALPTGVLMACYSCFADGAFVSTYYPRGATIKRLDLDVIAAGASPEATVLAHRARVGAFAPGHGSPLANRSMADLLQRDDTYRRRHGGATLRTRVYRFVALGAFVVLASGVELVRVVVLDR